MVGSALKTILPSATYLSSKDGDLTDLCQVRALFKKHQPKEVIHLAAKVGGVKTNAEKNADMLTINAQINTNVLSVARESGVQKLVAVSSNCVFDAHPPKPPVEADVFSGMPFHGHVGYGFAKRMLELQIRLLREQYDSKFTSVMPVTIIGPHDNWNFNESHVGGSLIHKCYLAKKNGTPMKVWGSGRAVRQFVYALDVARIILEVLKKYDDPETVIIAPDDGISIKTLAETIAKAMNFKGAIEFDTSQPEGESKRVLDGSKLRRLFPDFKFASLEESLKPTVEWFEKNYETIARKN